MTISFEITSSYRKQVFLLLKKIDTFKMKIDLKNESNENLQVQCPYPIGYTPKELTSASDALFFFESN